MGLVAQQRTHASMHVTATPRPELGGLVEHTGKGDVPAEGTGQAHPGDAM